MGFEMKAKRAVLKELARRYRRATKREKGRVWEEFISLTGYNRFLPVGYCAAITVLMLRM